MSNNPQENSQLGATATTAAVGGDSHNHPAIEPKLYGLVAKGQIDDFQDMVSQQSVPVLEVRCPIDQSSVLHIAALTGQANLTASLLNNYRNLIFVANKWGDLAIHTALKFNKLEAAKVIINWLQNSPFERANEVTIKQVLDWKNEEGKTPLHLAVESNECFVATLLVELYPQASYSLKEGVDCPIIIAIQSKHWKLVQHMLDRLHPFSDDTKHFLGRGSILHSFIQNNAHQQDFVKKLLDNAPELMDQHDGLGQTPLSLAAYMDKCELVNFFLTLSPDNVFKRDKDVDGSFPIHRAAKGGSINVIKLFLTTNMSLASLLNGKGQTIFHVAAASGHYDLISFLLRRPEIKGLANASDEDGNTPLHLATKGFHCKLVSFLYKKIPQNMLNSLNKDGSTPHDVLNKELQWESDDGNKTRQAVTKLFMVISSAKQVKNIKANPNSHSKDVLQSYLLVAILIVTVTFAAGFTVPGGFNQSDPDIGMATLAHDQRFQAFILYDSVALSLSLLSTVTIIWGLQASDYLAHLSVVAGLHLISCSLILMSLAFFSGVVTVLGSRPTLILQVKIFVSIVLLLIIECTFRLSQLADQDRASKWTMPTLVRLMTLKARAFPEQWRFKKDV